MIQILIESLASYIGGYFSQKAVESKISIKKFFFLIFILLEAAFIFAHIESERFLFKDILLGLTISLVIASLSCIAMFLYKKCKKFRD